MKKHSVKKNYKHWYKAWLKNSEKYKNFGWVRRCLYGCETSFKRDFDFLAKIMFSPSWNSPGVSHYLESALSPNPDFFARLVRAVVKELVSCPETLPGTENKTKAIALLGAAKKFGIVDVASKLSDFASQSVRCDYE